MKSFNRFILILCITFSAAVARAQTGTTSGGAQTPAASCDCSQPGQAAKLVQEMVDNQLSADKRDTNFRYQVSTVQGGATQVYDSISTREGVVSKLVLYDGKLPAPSQQLADDQRTDLLLTDQDARDKAKNSLTTDIKQANEMLQLLPNGFLYDYESTNGDIVRLRFRPNPAFQPHSRHANVLHHLSGSIDIDCQAKRMVHIEGTLMSDVTFGFGILGRLKKGGHFEVGQSEVVPGIWTLTAIRIQMNGRALLFHSISLQEDLTLSSFQAMPTKLNITQAVNILRASN